MPTKKELPFGEVNVELFQEVKRKILAEPEAFDMSQFGAVCGVKGYVNPKNIKHRIYPKCGTAACIFGWANALDHLKTHNTLRTCDIDDGVKAANLLGISVRYGDWDSVVLSDYWPAPYRERYNRAKTLKEAARVAADYIDYICYGKPSCTKKVN